MRLVLALLAAVGIAAAAPAVSPPDHWITAQIKIALLTSDQIDPVAVRVDTTDGHVTLHGKVRNEEERARALEIARRVEGVVDVRQLLQIVTAPDEAKVAVNDDRLGKHVSKVLRTEPFAGRRGVKVKSVDKGVVLLAGTADTMADYLLAVEGARGVQGVRRVFSEVRAPEGTLDWKERSGPARGDSYLTAATKLELVGDSRVPALDVHVDADHGVVVLFGVVPSRAERDAAESDAKKVRGVTRLLNELEIVPTSKRELVVVDDQIVRASVLTALTAHSIENVDVGVDNGAVHLTGTVPTIWKQLNAATVARMVPGVRSVQDDLQIPDAL